MGAFAGAVTGDVSALTVLTIGIASGAAGGGAGAFTQSVVGQYLNSPTGEVDWQRAAEAGRQGWLIGAATGGFTAGLPILFNGLARLLPPPALAAVGLNGRSLAMASAGSATGVLGAPPAWASAWFNVLMNQANGNGGSQGIQRASTRKEEHFAEWQLYNSRGKSIGKGSEMSGVEFALEQGERLSFPDQSWYGHTEGKIISNLMDARRLRPGHYLAIDGTLPPCSGCQNIMRWTSEAHQMELSYYDAVGNHWAWKNGVNVAKP